MSHSIRLAAILTLNACAPSPASGLSDGASGTNPPFVVSVSPLAPLDAAPPILQLAVESKPDGSWVDETRLALIAGHVGSAHLGQLARDEVSAALSERIVPSLIWRDDDVVRVAPLRPLELGESYAVASGAPKHAVELTVTETDELPTLALTWPPDGRGSGAWPARWCGDQPLPPGSLDVPLAPDRAAATLATGATSHGAGTACVRLVDPSESPPDALGLAPPAFAPDGVPLARLDPTPLRADAPPGPVAPVACEDGEVPIGPGCVQVWDDRALIHPPATPLLWVFAGLDRVVASEPDQPLLLDGLVPATAWTVALTVVDREGGEHHTSTSLTTAPPMAHVIINEVLANPVGEEPQQEWVELYNDGLAPAHLLGWQLEDVGGEASLPDVTLPPGAFALVVNESFDPESEWDPMPPPNVPLLRVAELGNNGLANGGEPMRLRNAMGVIVSRFPDEPKPKPGQSVARIHPKALDGVEGTFVRADPPTPGAPFVPISSR